METDATHNEMSVNSGEWKKDEEAKSLNGELSLSAKNQDDVNCIKTKVRLLVIANLKRQRL